MAMLGLMQLDILTGSLVKTLLTCMQQVLGLHLDWDTNYTGRVSVISLSASRQIIGQYLKGDPNRFLAHHFQFTIH
jgi:hypothetical protein